MELVVGCNGPGVQSINQQADFKPPVAVRAGPSVPTLQIHFAQLMSMPTACHSCLQHEMLQGMQMPQTVS